MKRLLRSSVADPQRTQLNRDIKDARCGTFTNFKYFFYPLVFEDSLIVVTILLVRNEF